MNTENRRMKEEDNKTAFGGSEEDKTDAQTKASPVQGRTVLNENPVGFQTHAMPEPQ